jgi:hypothetical protein
VFILRKITIVCAKIAVLILALILLLQFRSFTKKEISIIQNTPSQISQQTILVADSNINIDILQYPFSVGEKLKYFIYSAAIKVGEVDITYLGKKEIKGILRDVILLEAKAPGFTDKDTIYGDIRTFSPVRVERKIRLFGENMDIIEEYDGDGREVVITKMARKKTVQRIATPSKISNVILLLYHVRCNNYKYNIGKKFEFNLPTQKLEMRVEKNTKIKVPKGEFPAIFIKSIPSRFKVWFKKDDGLPLRIQGAIGFGNTYLDLKGVE